MRSLLYPPIDLALAAWQAAALRGYQASDTWCISSSPRGGSTWLADVVSRAGKRVTVWEPLHLANNPKAATMGFDWTNDVPVDAQLGPDDPRRAYIEDLLAGRDLSTRTLSRLSLHFDYLARFRGLVIKFVNAGMIIPWIAENYPAKCVHMVRHPCGVVASQLRHGAFEAVTKDNFEIAKSFADRHPEFVEAREHIETREELYALGWAMANYPAHFNPGSRLKVVRYEDLAASEEAIRDLLTYFGCVGVEEIDIPTLVNRQSTTTTRNSYGLTPTERTESWRKRLSAEQIDRVLTMVRRVGYTQYD